MIKFKHAFLLLFPIWVLALEGCSDAKSKEKGTGEWSPDYLIALADTIADADEPITDYIRVVKIALLSSDQDALITQGIEVIEMASGNFVIRDARKREVKLFDSDGTFLRKIGRGPAEYASVDDLTLASGSSQFIIIWSNDSKKLLFFNELGELLDEFSADFFAFCVEPVDDSRFLFWVEGNQSKVSGRAMMLEAKLEGGRILIENTYLEIPKEVEMLSFGPAGDMFAGSDGILMSKPYSDTILEFKNGRLHPKFVILNSRSPKSYQDLYLEKQGDAQAIKAVRNLEGTLYGSFLETDKHLYFSYILDGRILAYNFSKVDSTLIYTPSFPAYTPLIMSILFPPAGITQDGSLVSLVDLNRTKDILNYIKEKDSEGISELKDLYPGLIKTILDSGDSVNFALVIHTFE